MYLLSHTKILSNEKNTKSPWFIHPFNIPIWWRRHKTSFKDLLLENKTYFTLLNIEKKKTFYSCNNFVKKNFAPNKNFLYFQTFSEVLTHFIRSMLMRCCEFFAVSQLPPRVFLCFVFIDICTNTLLQLVAYVYM